MIPPQTQTPLRVTYNAVLPGIVASYRLNDAVLSITGILPLNDPAPFSARPKLTP